jgi:hypothetical protein
MPFYCISASLDNTQALPDDFTAATINRHRA